jgi:hypothetical protein
MTFWTGQSDGTFWAGRVGGNEAEEDADRAHPERRDL